MPPAAPKRPPQADNGDHGHCVNNTCNHNVACGIFVDTPLRGWIIMGNNCWASLGGPLGTTKLSSYNGSIENRQNYAYGMYIQDGKGLIVIGNDISRNQFNLCVNRCVTSTITGNQFKVSSDVGVTGIICWKTP